jgi:acyl-coenzyme A thioesterase 13
MSATNLLALVRQAFTFRADKGCFDKVLEKVTITAASPGKVTAELIVGQEHTNHGGFLHGGLAATIVDSVSTMAMYTFTESENLSPGVSIDLNVQYMSAANIGETILIEASALKKGKNLAFLSVDILNKANGRLVCRGSHLKYIATPKL